MQSWRELFRQLKQRGVKGIGMVIADGVDSVHKALREVFSMSREQRCWVHKMRNVLDKVPCVAEGEVRAALQVMYNARLRDEALRLKAEFVANYEERYPRAVASLEEAGDLLFTYFDFPKEHWKSIKTTNPLESMFSSVRLRTDAPRRIPVPASGAHLVFKVLTYVETRLHRIHGYKLVVETIDRMQHCSQ
ncbi:transposase [candidate division KSB1 bacterium]|nr:transposase [candidate division KSB1 bacterium]